MRKDSKTKHARHLRKTLTAAETRLWARLRRQQIEGFRFRRQHPIGPFIVDFACIEAKLIVEVDGATHSTEDEQASDRRRSTWLCREGWQIVRTWNSEVYDNIDGVLEAIRIALLDQSF
ncbi:endonuclease domain-containing protein [Henriciella sp. AS95]|uniref:endonuclease domain-containing protein n=1 Tax=Henriciella sp. AS95 TaxID=3135782 RepID=UPI00317333F2